MEKSMLLGLLFALFTFSSCSNDDENTKNEYDGVVFASVGKSQCLGDVYGANTNNVDLWLTNGNIHFNEETGFEGEGTCLVLALLSKIAKDGLPVTGTYVPANWEDENVSKEQTFDPGFCVYQEDYSAWLTSGTYLVSIDKSGNETYMAFCGGSVVLSSTSDGYQVDVALRDEDGKEFKARYIGKISFELPAIDDPAEKYKYEDTTPENLTPTVNSVDIRFFGIDETTGLTEYKVQFWTEERMIADLIVNMPASAKGMLPDGTYNVNEYPVENSILAGYYENERYAGSCLGLFDNSYGQRLKVWYLVDGELTTKSIDESLKIKLNATSAYGSVISMNYEGIYTFTDATIVSR